MKKNKILPIILIILGLAFLIMPIYSNYLIKQNQNKVTIEDMTSEQLRENLNKNSKNSSFDFSKVKEISPSSTFLNISQIDKSVIIGQIVIPSVNINLAILKGATNENLLAGAGTMKSDDRFGEGNFTLAGHFNKDKSILFGPLMDIKKGDIIRVTDKSMIYEYKVYENKTVPDDALYMIDNKQSQKRGNPIISLMTCYYSSKTGKRYFVLGDLVKKYPYKKELMYDKTPSK